MPSDRFPQRSPSFGFLGWLVVLGSLSVLGACPRVWAAAAEELLPTGVRITPEAAEGALFQPLQPHVAPYPEVFAGQAVTTAVSPDGTTLLILTSGFNRTNAPDGHQVPEASTEYVFIYDITGQTPAKRQVLPVPNAFNGLAWHPQGQQFYVSGGMDDTVHVFERRDGVWQAAGAPIPLGHTAGHGLEVKPMVAGLAVNASGTRVLVANFANDSVSVLDLAQRAVVAEVDLRPGKADPAQPGGAGGEYPFWIAFQADSKAYVSSQRDREVVVLDLQPPIPRVQGRITVGSQPNKLLLNRAQTRVYVANGTSDTVSVIDTSTDRVLEEINTTAPVALFANPQGLKGSNPNSLALSPDERTLYVTNGGSNAVAVVRLRPEEARPRTGEAQSSGAVEAEEPQSHVLGLLPTGWYPHSVSLSPDGTWLYIVNGKSTAGPNPGACRDTLATSADALAACRGRNLYIWQLTRAGFLSVPVPTAASLAQLSWQVADNNNFPAARQHREGEAMMAFLRRTIKHVVYIVKENRSYDQVLGDLEVGNGDPALALFPEPITPNHHALARRFVTLDHFLASGEVSGDGWNWSTAARTTDFTEKTVPMLYAGRGLTYDVEGKNRNINVGLATLAERQAANPRTPSDPDLLPGTADVAAPDGPQGEAGTGYLWDAALRRGLTVRNYGFFGDLARYAPNHPAFIPVVRQPFASGQVQFFPTKAALQPISDPYFRGYDQKNADFWLFKEWEREFDAYVQHHTLPALQLVRLPHDHFGSFAEAIDGVNTPDAQIADNDYAVGLLVEKVAKSPYKDETLICILEDDAQNGADHVDAHRSLAYLVGPYVKQGAVVSTSYTTVHLLRTIEAILGLEPMGLTDGLAAPMAEVFEQTLRPWTYTALVPEVLRTTQLPLPPKRADNSLPATDRVLAFSQPRGTAAAWEAAMAGQNFTVEDDLEEARFNRALWSGLQGAETPYPTTRHGQNLTHDRVRLLETFWAQHGAQGPPRPTGVQP
jgi:YVTN family beta-propeller protein